MQNHASRGLAAVITLLCGALSGSVARAQPTEGTPAADAATPPATAAGAQAPAQAPAPADDEAVEGEVGSTSPPASSGAAGDEEPSGAAAEDATGDFSDRWVALGLKTGIYVPSVVNEMGPHVDVGLEGTLLLPFIARRLGVMLEIGWSPPGASGSREDPRLGDSGGPWRYEMTTQELFFSLGPVVRFLPPGSTVVPYLGVLGRLYLLETTVSGTGNGQAFGENSEHSTQVGVTFLGGGELRLGPGAALLEVSFGFSSLPHTITGDTSTGALAIEIGYRLFL